MATMKDFLRSSIMAGGSVAAAPSGQTVSISAKSSVGDWAEICNFVSPNNGYVQVKGISTELGAVSTILVDSGFAGASWSGSGLDLGYCLPVKRGDTVNVFGSYLKNVTVVLRVLGGAKIPVAQIFWRVVPCLRTCLTRALTPIADRIRVSSQGAILQLTSRSRQGMRTSMQPLTFLRATACSSSSVSPLKATPTTTSRFDEISSTVGSLGATGRRGRFLRLLAERAKRFTGTRGLMELLRTSKRTSAFTHTSALNVCFGGASYE